MQNPEDIARMWYVIRNYDNIEAGGNTSKEYRNRDNTPGKKVVITKQIDGTYYVVEAVTDAGKVGIVSAYIRKKAGASQVPDARPNRSPLATSGNELVSTPNSNIAQNDTDVKRFVRERVPGEIDQTEDFELMRDALRDKARDWSDERLAREIENARAVRDDIGQTDSNREYQQYRLDALEPEQQARTLTKNSSTATISTQPAAHQAAENGGKTNGRGTQISDDSSQRDAGLGSGEQTGGVETGAGESVRSGKRATEASLIARVKAAGSAAARSAAQIGVEGGGRSKTLYVLSDEIVAQSPRWTAIREDAASRGARTVFFAGTLTVRNSTNGTYDAVEGLRQTGRDGQTTYYIKADKMQRNAQQIYLHEIFHDAVAQNRGLLLDLTEELYRRYGKQEVARLVNDYVSAYRGIYGVFTEEMTADEQAELELRYLEELFADLYAGIRRGQVNSGSAQSVIENRRGDIGRETSRATRDTRGAPEQKFSIQTVEGENGQYEDCVVLDTRLFDGVKPRNWGKVLSRFVYENLAGTQLTMYDADGNAETVEIARENERVRKDGAKNSHKVIDKLSRYTGNNTVALATVHLSELLQVSQNESSTDERSHQWMDKNGWTIRHAYLMDRGGKIYDATLNIANGERRILYAVNNVRQIDKNGRTAGGDVPSGAAETAAEGARSTSHSSPNGNIADNGKNVKQKFSVEDDTIPEDAETVQQAARAEKERRADAASINTLKSRVQTGEEAVKAQKAALRALR